MATRLSHADSTPITNVKSYARIPKVLDIPNLIQSQIQSFDWFRYEGLAEVYHEISPIKDYTGNKYELYFLDHYFRDPKYSPEECKQKEITCAAPLYVKTRLVMKETEEIKEQEIFMGDLPMMTSNGTFVVNGAERVVVSQLVRSPGAYFVLDKDITSDRDLCSAKLIPSRGAWLEFETSSKNVLSVKVDRKRKVSATTVLRAIGIATDEELLDLFQDVDTHEAHHYMKSTLERDPVQDERDVHFREDDLKSLWQWLRPDEEYNRTSARKIASAQIDFYRRLRPGEPPSLDNARSLVRDLFFEPRRYDLGKVGRYKLNSKLGTEEDPNTRTLTRGDLLAMFRTMIKINNGEGTTDDIDHLGNRRVRAVGELVQNQMRVGMLRMERMVKERMTLIDPEQATPQALVNIRPVVAAVREFFGGSQLSQFMDQTNPLAELTHKRRLSALGPGGLSRERAGFDVRDVHFSHYGRICPIESPEGPNIGLLSSLATYARINPFGFIESPYRRVLRELLNSDPELEDHTLDQDVMDTEGNRLGAKRKVISKKMLQGIASLPATSIKVKPFVSKKNEDITYLSADKEEGYIIAQANAQLDSKNQFVQDRVEVRIGENYAEEAPEAVDFMDVSSMQITSVSASLIPFLEHDDANRALMGSNMQRQSVPLLRPQAPLVGTGIEGRVAKDSGQVILASADGVVSSVSGTQIVVKDHQGQEHIHPIVKFARTNQGTCFNQRAMVQKGDVVKEGDVLADSSSTDRGELALGQNVLLAFMIWEGYNYEDAVIISERLVKDDYFTSVHIEKYEMEARETKLGPEEITRDIPNVGEDSLRDLDETGIIRVGAEVGPGDVLVGKVTPKGETELTAEEKLLRAIFGEKSRDVKDTSLRVPHGERGKIIDVRIMQRGNKDELPPGVNEAVRVWVAQTRRVSIGDKMAGRHGNKGVIARILPVEDMPFLADGTPVDIILNPLGVPSRMNLGQVLETHLGWAAKLLNFRATTPVFDGAKDIAIEDALARAWFAQQAGAIDPDPSATSAHVDIDRVKDWLKEKGYDPERLFDDSVIGEASESCLRIWLKEEAGFSTEGLSLAELQKETLRLHMEEKLAPPTFGKVTLFDGRTGQPFDQPVTVGYIYMLKLIHLVEDKIHARSTGPYSLITQQPLGGKAQFGGQRFGEMEVWALEAYGAAHNLQEVLTVKSDDVAGRVKTYEAIVKGDDIVQPGVPESFNVLLKELQSLGLAVELLNEDERTPFTRELTESLDGEEPDAEQAVADQPVDGQPMAEQAVDGQQIDGQPMADQPEGEQTVVEQTAADQSLDGLATDGQLADQPEGEQTVVEQTAADQSLDGQPLDGLATDGQPMAEQPVVEQTAADQSIDEQPVDSLATDAQPMADQPEGEQTAADQSIDEQPVDGLATDGQPMADQPEGEQTAADQSIDEQPVDGLATDGQPMADQPEGEQTVVEQIAADQSLDGQPADGQPMAEQMLADQPVVEQTAADQSIDEQPVDTLATDGQPMADQPEGEQTVVEQTAADQSLDGQPVDGLTTDGQPMADHLVDEPTVGEKPVDSQPVDEPQTEESR